MKPIRPLFLVAALLLAGCATGETPMRRFALSPSQSENDALLGYAASLRNRSAAELNAELENLNKAHAGGRSESARLRLALFHAVAANGDRTRAAGLLDVPPGEANGKGRNHPLAQLLLPALLELRRQDEALSAAQNKLRDEQKRTEAAQQKLEAAQQKLGALRDIENRMLERTLKRR